MKTGYMECDAGDMFVVGSDGGIYNIIFKKQLLNKDNKVCGNMYVHASNCTLDKNGKYIAHGSDESRTTIAYHQLCDLAKVPYNTSCDDLFKALNTVLCPDGYKSNPNRTERREKK